MVKFYLKLIVIASLVCIGNSIKAQNLSIPDANFKAALVANSAINTNGDGEIQVSEALAYTGAIDISRKEISDLSGIEYFTKITGLVCSRNPIGSLDVSKNTRLTYLFCSRNQLTSLDVSKNTSLTQLNCTRNPIGSLDVSQNIALTQLDCYNNELKVLDVSKNIALISLACQYNELTRLDLSKNTVLTDLYCSYNQLTALDISKKAALISITCTHNQFPFSELKKIKDNFASLTYTTNKKLFTLLSKKVGETVDYSAESEFNGQTTTFTWYNNSNVAVDETFVKESSTSPSFFQFLQAGTYYCKMTNDYFTGTELKTENINITDFAINIPDTNFKSALVANNGINTNRDTEIQMSEVLTYTGAIDISRKNISDLSGIEYFTKITVLSCTYNQLTSLDVSKNTALTGLYCRNNQLTNLDVSKNIALTGLNCISNELTTLNVSKNTALIDLYCYNNQLTNLDVSKNIALTNLYCGSNQLSNLDVSKNTAIAYLKCSHNQLTSLDVSKNTAIIYLECYKNQLSNLDLKNTVITNLVCYENQLTSLDLSKTIRHLECYENQLTNLDLSNSTAIRHLACSNNKLTALDVSKNTAITTLACSNNKLTVLDVSKNTAITTLYCFYNQLTSLDVSKNTAITYLYCSYNQLKSLDLSKNTGLAHLNCNDNLFTSLDVSKNTALSRLNCSKNKLTALDISKNPDLYFVYCSDNQLTDLDLSKNTALTTLTCTQNHFPFSELKKVKDHFPGLTYTSDKKIFTPLSKKVGETIDYSAEREFNGTITTFTWYNSSDVEVDVTFVKEKTANSGIFEFLKAGTYYCKMSNAHFTGTELKTENITITDFAIAIPDTNFKASLVADSGINTNSDTEIQMSEALAFSGAISLRDENISKLTGIEFFTEITVLYCLNSQLTELDLTNNTRLTGLYCYNNNKLTKLNVSKNTKLTDLHCYKNQLTELNVSNNILLTDLKCYENQITVLDVSKNTALTDLWCHINQLTKLDVSKNTVLEKFDCSQNGLTELNVNQNTGLKEFACYSNQLTELDVSQNTGLFLLSCHSNKLTELNVNQNTGIFLLNCKNNKLTDLDISKNTRLRRLYTEQNRFPFSGLKKLKDRFSSLNYISDKTIFTPLSKKIGETIDYSAEREFNGNITTFTWYNNSDVAVAATVIKESPTSPGVFQFLQAGTYYCKMSNAHFTGTKLKTDNITVTDFAIAIPDANFKAALVANTSINTNKDSEIQMSEALIFSGTISVSYKGIADLTGIESFINMTQLACHGNQLTSLDLSKNTAILSLGCSKNKLNSLDLGNNTTIKYLNCNSNLLTNLDLSNNTAITTLWCNWNQLSRFNLNNNTAITKLICDNNQLTGLNLENNKAITKLICHHNQLNSLNLEKNTVIQELNCSSNQLNNLDLSKNTALKLLLCYENIITSLDVSNNTNIIELTCYGNLLRSLNLLYNTRLSKLYCSENKIPFSELQKIKDNFSSLTYTSDKSLFVSLDKKVGESIDYSAEREFNGQTTVFTWYNSLDGTVDASFVKEKTANSGIFEFLKAGSYYCKMSNAHFPITELKTEKLTVSKKAQTISFSAASTAKVKDELILAASSDSGLAITYSIVSGDATINGSAVTFNQAGTVEIKATQIGNNEYLVAEAKTISVTVSKKAQTISFSAVSTAKVKDELILAASSDSDLAIDYSIVSGDATINGSAVTFNQAGAVEIKATQIGNNEYLVAEAKTISVTVSKKEQSISFSAASIAKVKDELILAASSDSGLAIAYSIVSGDATLNDNTVTFNQAGTVEIKATQIGNNEYLVAEAKTISVTVSKKAQTISFTAPTEAKVKDELILAASSDSGLAITYSIVSGDATLNDNTVTFNQAGTVEIKATQAGNDDYLAAEAKTITVAVSKKAQTISFFAASTAKVKDELILAASSDSGLAINYSIVSGDATLNDNIVTFNQAGAVEIKATQIGNNEYLVAEAKTISVTVSKKEQSISFSAASTAKVKDELILAANSDSGLAIDYNIVSGDATLNDNTVTFNQAGTVEIKATQIGNDEYLVAEAKTISVTVSKKAQTISFTAPTEAKVKDELILAANSDSDLAIAYSIVSGDATLNDNTVTFNQAGVVEIKATQAGNEEYLSAEEIITVQVSVFTGIIEDPLKQVKLSLYPNPTPSAFTIDLGMEPEDKVHLAIYDLSGQLIDKQVYRQQKLNYTKVLKAGVYIVLIQYNGSRRSKKLVVK